MPYAAPFLKLVMSGTFYTTEVFSTSLAIAQNFDGPLTQPEDLAPYAAACSTWFAASPTAISSSAKLELIKVNMIGEDGFYVNKGETFFSEYATPVSGGGPSGGIPQLTLATSLTTFKSRGLAHRGRLYPPLTNTPISNGRVAAAACQSMANSMATFINSLNAIGPGDVSVVSSVREGAVNIVRGVEVGDVMDTQRRRRNALQEVYTANSIALVGVTPPP